MVEDNASTSSWSATCSSTPGYEVVGRRPARRASRLAGEQPPDLVLMDLQLPGIDGHETLRRLRGGVRDRRRAGGGGDRASR